MPLVLQILRNRAQTATGQQDSLSNVIVADPLLYRSLAWVLWLADIIQALHLDLSLNFSSGEVWTQMTSSAHEFSNTYCSLLQEPIATTRACPIYADATSEEDAVLLLMAILSDSINLHRSLGRVVDLDDQTNKTDYSRNPFVPLSPYTELKRMREMLVAGLQRWYKQFEGLVSPSTMALYHYSISYLSCNSLRLLPRIAGYPLFGIDTSHTDSVSSLMQVKISDESVGRAWMILDSSALRSKASEALCPIWLPVIVFHAALIVWANISRKVLQKQGHRGSIRSLLVFKVEVESMPWPCCQDMATTLERLISNPITSSSYSGVL